VLSTMNWNQVAVGVLIIECSRSGCTGSGDKRITESLESKGLRRIATVKVRSDIYNAAFLNTSWVPTWEHQE
jgi:hypothetical protein